MSRKTAAAVAPSATVGRDTHQPSKVRTPGDNEDSGLVKWNNDGLLTNKFVSQLHSDQELRKAIIPDGSPLKVDDDDNSKDELFFKLAQVLFKGNAKYKPLVTQINRAEANKNIGEIAKLMKARWRQMVDTTKIAHETAGSDAKGIKNEKELKSMGRGDIKSKLESIKATYPWYFKIRGLLREPSNSAELADVAPGEGAAASTEKHVTEHQSNPQSNALNDESEPAPTAPLGDTKSALKNPPMDTTVESSKTEVTEAITPRSQTLDTPNPPVKAADGLELELDKDKDKTQGGESVGKLKVVDTQSVPDGTGAPTAQGPVHNPITTSVSPLEGDSACQATPQVQDHVSLGVEGDKEPQGHTGLLAPGRPMSRPRSTASAQRIQTELESPILGKTDEIIAESALQAKSPGLIIPTEPITVNGNQLDSLVYNETDQPLTPSAHRSIPDEPTAPSAHPVGSRPLTPDNAPIVPGHVTTRLEQEPEIITTPPDNTLSASNGAPMISTFKYPKTGATEDIASRSETPHQRDSSMKAAGDESSVNDKGENTVLVGTNGDKHEDTHPQSVTGGAGAHTAQVLAPIPINASVPSLLDELARKATPQGQGLVSLGVEDGKEWQGHTSRPVIPIFGRSIANAHGIQEMTKAPGHDKSDELPVASVTPTIFGAFTPASPNEPTIMSAHQVGSSMPIIVDELTMGPEHVEPVVIIPPSDDTPSAPNGAPMVTSVKNSKTQAREPISSRSPPSRQIDSLVKADDGELDVQPDEGGNLTQKGTGGGEILGRTIPSVQDSAVLDVDDERGRRGRSSRLMTPAFGHSPASTHRVHEGAESRIPAESDAPSAASTPRVTSPVPLASNVASPMIDALTTASAHRARSPAPVVHHEPARTGARARSPVHVIPDEPAMRLAQVVQPRPKSPVLEGTGIVKNGVREVVTATPADQLGTMSPTDIEALGPDSGEQLPLYSIEDGITPAGPSRSGNHNPEHISNSAPEGKHRDEKHIFSALRTSNALSTPQIHSNINVASESDVASPEKVGSGKTSILERTGEANRAVSPAHVPAPERVAPPSSVKNPTAHPAETIRKPTVKGDTRNIRDGSPGSHPSKAPLETAMRHIVSADTPVASESLATKAGQVGTSESRNVSSESQATVRATDRQPGPEIPHIVHQNKDNFSKTPRSSVQLHVSQSQRAPAPIPAPSPSYTTPAFPPGPSPESSQAAPSHFRTMKPPLNTPGNATFPTVDTQDQPTAPRSQMEPHPVSVARPRGAPYATPAFPPGPPPPEPSSAITSRPQTVKLLLSRLGRVTSPTAETQPQLPVGSQRPEQVKHAARIPTPKCVIPVLSVGTQQNPPVKVAIQPTTKDSTRDNSIRNVNLVLSHPSEAPSRRDLTSAAKRTASAASVAVTPVISESLATGGKQAGVSRPKNLSGESQAAVKAKDRQQEQEQGPEPEIPIVYQEKDFIRKKPQSPVQVLAPRSQMAAPLPMPVSGPKSSSVVIPAFQPGPLSPTVPSRLRTVEPLLSTPGSATLPIAETQLQPPVVTSEIPNHYARTMPPSMTAAAASIPTPIITNIDDQSHLSSDGGSEDCRQSSPLRVTMSVLGHILNHKAWHLSWLVPRRSVAVLIWRLNLMTRVRMNVNGAKPALSSSHNRVTVV
ncbi:hypothetical protein FRB95_005566 [Tulasnella sp. JGI-2019a]|nr:hypothetical protein FRB95_005566 [Tulasnella sp. JGI-2019a]